MSSQDGPSTRRSDTIRSLRTSGPEKEILARVRVVAATDGRQWVVKEVPSSQSDGGDGPSLLFSSNSVIRRVRDFPPDWFDWSDEELIAVSLRR
jgi:hypothetical protein